MRLIDATATNMRLFGMLAILVAALGISLAFGLTATGVLANHTNTHVIHACVDTATGAPRFVQNPNQCQANEVMVEWQNAAGAAALEARITALEDDNATQQAEIDQLETQIDDLLAQVPDCLTTQNGNAVFEGCNVYVQNGLDNTASTNGTGNLIIGYNEKALGADDRTGSHNLVVGPEHGYSNFGGFVAGFDNTVTGEHATVSGGTENIATGLHGSVSGGNSNEANGEDSSVSGGVINVADGLNSSVSGGLDNGATGTNSSVSGGAGSFASGVSSSVSGGFVNTASGDWSSVSGGEGNTAGPGQGTSVSGGLNRTAPNVVDWVAGALFQNF